MRNGAEKIKVIHVTKRRKKISPHLKALL